MKVMKTCKANVVLSFLLSGMLGLSLPLLGPSISNANLKVNQNFSSDFLNSSTSRAKAITPSTAIVVESGVFSSLNTYNWNYNLSINTDVAYLTGAGFWHYDDKAQIVPNTALGSYAVTTNKPGDFEVTYTLTPGRLWSDGTPVTAADLLLWHVISSSAFAKASGLGDPAISTAFQSVNYGGIYDQHIVGVPTISADQLSATFKYDTAIPDYVLNGPNLSLPVHILEELMSGNTSLQSNASNLAANAKFITDVQSMNTANLQALANIFNNSFNISTVDNTTNPLLLVNNGAYKVSSIGPTSIILTASPTYNSGPSLSGISSIVIDQGVPDGISSAQAIAAGTADVYQSINTSASLAVTLRAIPGTVIEMSNSYTDEHVGLRVGSNTSTPYSGPFSMSGGQKAADLRRAFLLAYPRQQIVSQLVQPINPSSQVVNSNWSLPGNPNYATATAQNGSIAYSFGTQAQRTEMALALVKKWYPSARGGITPVPINLLWGTSLNTRRQSEANMVIAAEAQAGFAVAAPANDSWATAVTSPTYDAQFFVWANTANQQDAQLCEEFRTGGWNNFIGYSNPIVDSDCSSLQNTSLSPASILSLQIEIESQINKDAVYAGLFENPVATIHNVNLVGPSASAFSPTLFWNFWTWHYGTPNQAPTPTFGAITRAPDGYSFPINNFDSNFLWNGADSAGGAVAISSTGIVTVSGLPTGTSSIVTISSSRSGFAQGVASLFGNSTVPAQVGVQQNSTTVSPLGGFVPNAVSISIHDAIGNAIGGLGSGIFAASSNTTIISNVLAGSCSFDLSTASPSYLCPISSLPTQSVGGSVLLTFGATTTQGVVLAAPATFTVTPLPQSSVSVSAVTSPSGASAVVAASGGSGILSYVFTAANGSASGCQLSGTTLTATSSGTCLVSAHNLSNGIYAQSAESTPLTVTLSLLSALNPTFSIPVSTATGFTVNVTNYNPSYTFTPTISAGTVTKGNASGTTLPLTVTGLTAGQSATITMTVTRSGYANGSATITALSLLAALVPTFSTPVVGVSSFSVNITNYNPAFSYTITATAGTVAKGVAVASTLPLTISGLTSINRTSTVVTVTVTRAGYATGTGKVTG